MWSAICRQKSCSMLYAYTELNVFTHTASDIRFYELPILHVVPIWSQNRGRIFGIRRPLDPGRPLNWWLAVVRTSKQIVVSQTCNGKNTRRKAICIGHDYCLPYCSGAIVTRVLHLLDRSIGLQQNYLRATIIIQYARNRKT